VPDDGNQGKRPELGQGGEARAGGHHEGRRREQQRSIVVTMGREADGERHDAGAEQRGGRDDPHHEAVVSQFQEVQRQQQADEAVAEGA
jgi:hypothetical protein